MVRQTATGLGPTVFCGPRNFKPSCGIQVFTAESNCGIRLFPQNLTFFIPTTLFHRNWPQSSFWFYGDG